MRLVSAFGCHFGLGEEGQSIEDTTPACRTGRVSQYIWLLKMYRFIILLVNWRRRSCCLLPLPVASQTEGGFFSALTGILQWLSVVSLKPLTLSATVKNLITEIN
jgi:hypothetical protein